jgi:RNA polymerase sigma-70 factor (ECF subfamily)
MRAEKISMAHPVRKVQARPRIPEQHDTETSAGSPSQSPSALQYKLAVLRHYRAVFGFASALMSGAAEAEDVTQEAFVRFWQRGGTVRRQRQWLLRVARNLCLDRLRVDSRLVPHSEEAGSEVSDDRDPEWQLGQDELAQDLRRHITALPEPQRSLVVLFDLHGMSGEQCAAVVGISVNQVKVYLHRARKRLRQKLEGRYRYAQD